MTPIEFFKALAEADIVAEARKATPVQFTFGGKYPDMPCAPERTMRYVLEEPMKRTVLEGALVRVLDVPEFEPNLFAFPDKSRRIVLHSHQSGLGSVAVILFEEHGKPGFVAAFTLIDLRGMPESPFKVAAPKENAGSTTRGKPDATIRQLLSDHGHNATCYDAEALLIAFPNLSVPAIPAGDWPDEGYRFDRPAKVELIAELLDSFVGTPLGFTQAMVDGKRRGTYVCRQDCGLFVAYLWDEGITTATRLIVRDLRDLS